MKDEIKEIQERLDYHKAIGIEPEYCEDLITTGELQRLLDYITNLQEENKKLNLIIKAIKKQCDVTENYEINEFIRQLEEEPLDSTWLKRVAGESK